MIHPQAIIEEGAVIGQNVTIGPWTYISKNVVIGDDCHIGPNVVINGPTELGKGNKIFQFASIGEDCQDLKYSGEPTKLIVGDNNIFRESCTVHRGTIQDQGITEIGSNNLFMAYTHVAHDCVVGNHCILANNASIAGHVHVGDYAILGGQCGVHQFCHIGAHSFVAATSLILKDVPPYVMASGNAAKPYGLNSEGLKRRGFSSDAIKAIKKAYRKVFRAGLTVDEALAVIAEEIPQQEEVSLFTDFINQSNRGIIR
ncbi:MULTISPECIES: acyl-ACP--UDP-N-acetylglucosamine O-acyltransferase [Thalassotalea]|uniref:acyl-ACP--UDP-N-acetylglucosamine O-acyltransferase n=1 Tax=Thalassotalea TaxID=1518149 RepID=UPI00094390F7|nr:MULTISPECIES: acyl-ACP--UDP-N-acetylglucosamine O-acyltransferase [Thalassotalea]OKY26377.1 acyl-[acyl-carrier-protein]--UDP-N-acetylglucosamine O-acyltransferase [Thalassotalea sp. PP2-459]